MKRQLTFAIFALLITTIFAGNASAQFGDFINKAKDKVEKVKKTKQEIEQLVGASGNKNTKNQESENQNNNNDPDSWITFSKTHTRNNEAHIMSMNTLGCGDSVFATVNYREPVDNSGGFTVSMLVDGAVVAKESMSGGSATSVNQTIHIELIPAENANDDYPKVTFTKAGTILNRLQPGNHAIQLVVSLNDNPKNIAVGEFEYTGGAGCGLKKPGKPNTQKNTTKINQQPAEPQKTAMVELELQGACGESARIVTIDGGPYDRRTVIVHNGNTREKAAVGAQIFLKADQGIDTTLIYTVGSASFQVVKVCQ